MLVKGPNLAKYRPASQSTTDNPQSMAMNAVDGNTDTADVFTWSITESGDTSPWWRVDLKHHTWVTHVSITNVDTNGESHDSI